jgi:hypothetical protein
MNVARVILDRSQDPENLAGSVGTINVRIPGNWSKHGRDGSREYYVPCLSGV